MRYEVPQFIDVEEHVIGPLTLAQFFYLAGGAGAVYLSLRFLPSVINFVVACAIGLFAVALSFFRINDRPFPVMLFAILSHLISPRMYVWSFERLGVKHNKKHNVVSEYKNVHHKNISEQKLNDISWSLDIHNREY